MTSTKVTYREALRMGLEKALKNDQRVFLMGEDIGLYGGCYAVSKGFYQEFGPERIRDAPLSENAFVGVGIGAALMGMRPIVEIMTINFSLLALDQIINNAALLRHMSGGQLSVPLVIRTTSGTGNQLAAQHSHSFEGWFAHVPGIKILAPATIEDAYGMIEFALYDPDPVLIVEYAKLFNVEGEISGRPIPPVNQAVIRREGEAVTVVTYGAMLVKALEAAEELAAERISAEIIDLRSLRPLDMATVIASIRKTHRVLIVDEGWKSGSLSAEITARIVEEAFYELDAPVERLCSLEVPIPYARHLEEAAIPQVETIKASVRKVVTHHV